MALSATIHRQLTLALALLVFGAALSARPTVADAGTASAGSLFNPLVGGDLDEGERFPIAADDRSGSLVRGLLGPGQFSAAEPDAAVATAPSFVRGTWRSATDGSTWEVTPGEITQKDGSRVGRLTLRRIVRGVVDPNEHRMIGYYLTPSGRFAYVLRNNWKLWPAFERQHVMRGSWHPSRPWRSVHGTKVPPIAKRARGAR